MEKKPGAGSAKSGDGSWEPEEEKSTELREKGKSRVRQLAVCPLPAPDFRLPTSDFRLILLNNHLAPEKIFPPDFNNIKSF